MDFAEQKTEGARDMYCNLELTSTKESCTHSPSVAYGASFLPEEALDTTVFSLFFICIMLIGIASLEPRDYRVVFVIQ